MQIWNDFKEYYDYLSDINLTSDLSNTAFEKAKQWVELFCSLRQFRTGYTRAKITPYMHAHHVLPCSIFYSEVWLLQKVHWARCGKKQ